MTLKGRGEKRETVPAWPKKMLIWLLGRILQD